MTDATELPPCMDRSGQPVAAPFVPMQERLGLRWRRSPCRLLDGGSAPALDLRRGDVLPLWRTGAGGFPVLPGVRSAGVGGAGRWASGARSSR